MTNFKPYPKYKDSGVEWLGEIPEGWKTDRMRNSFTFRKGLTITKENLQLEGIPTINYGEVHSKFGFRVTPEEHKLKCVSPAYVESDPKALLLKHDFIFADTSEDLEGSGNFSRYDSDSTAFAGYHTVIARNISMHSSEFLAYLLDSPSFRNQVRRNVKGVKVYSITQGILKGLGLLLPPKSEQIAIANFLDEKVGKIDAAIAQKERLIELLNERKQIIIQNAVTKGLNPKAPMRDSGIEWIGEIPEHWEVDRMRNNFTFRKGLTITKENLLLEGVPAINYGEVHSKYGFRVAPEEHELKCVSPDYFKSSPKASLVKDDFIFADTSEDLEGSGNFSRYDSDALAFAGYHTIIGTNESKHSSEFLAYFFTSTSFRVQVRRKVKGVKVYSITQAVLKGLGLLLPPQSEQVAIINFLDDKLEKINAAISEAKKSIDKLKEYKATLINSAVTGKIKVS